LADQFKPHQPPQPNLFRINNLQKTILNGLSIQAVAMAIPSARRQQGSP
jgi:hypothetical protein